MDRIFLAVIVSGLLLIVAAASLLVLYKDDQASLLRHPPGIGLTEPKQVLPGEPLALAIGVFHSALCCGSRRS